jgi:hypothetical protein
MKLFSQSVFGLALAALLSFGITRPASAQFAITINVDEKGNGTLTNTNGFFSPLPAALLPDPGPGGLPAALTYGLLNPPGLVAGDLLMVEPGLNGQISDIIRFNPQQNGGSLVFYSDTADGSDSLADVGFPTALYTNTSTFVEVGPEGANGLAYTPTAGQPGFVAGAAGPVTYDITSDAEVNTVVPEPGSLALLASGGLPLVGLLRRRRAIL